MEILLAALTATQKITEKILDYHLEWLKLLTAEQRAKVLQDEVEDRQFWHNLGEPIRTLVQRIVDKDKEKPA